MFTCVDGHLSHGLPDIKLLGKLATTEEASRLTPRGCTDLSSSIYYKINSPSIGLFS